MEQNLGKKSNCVATGMLAEMGCHTYKKELTKRYYQIKSEIEDMRNSLREIGNQEKWFEWIDVFGDYIKNQREISNSLIK